MSFSSAQLVETVHGLQQHVCEMSARALSSEMSSSIRSSRFSSIQSTRSLHILAHGRMGAHVGLRLDLPGLPCHCSMKLSMASGRSCTGSSALWAA